MAVAVLVLYRATLLPSFDFGDTASFQAIGGSPFITPRDGYPLYFAVGSVALRLTEGDPGRALNLVSAVAGAIATGVIVLVAAELSGSIGAGVAVALLFAGSYTFWSQAVIAEVYTLHIVFLSTTLLLLLAWERRPTTLRLALFLAVFAIGFGNHLSMILLAPAYAGFLALAAPRGWRSLATPSVAGLALLFATLGALQYGLNLRTLWLLPQPPHGIIDALARFWFDVTKSDWRDTMVVHVPRSMLMDRAAMYGFDLRQQFGIAAALAACVGLGVLWFQSSRRAALLLGVYLANVLFAYTYNVGDSHVFYLPSHLVVALLVAPAIACAGRKVTWPHAATAAAVAYAATRIYYDYPALDRSRDRRPAAVLEALTAGLDDQSAILLTDLNWQVQNGLTYFAGVANRHVAHTRLSDVMLYAPALVADNAAIDREVTLTERARTELEAAYGPLLPTAIDNRVARPTLESTARSLAPGTRYIMCILRPLREVTMEWSEVGRALAALGDSTAVRIPDGDYVAVAGIVGEPVTAAIGRNRPFRTSVSLDGLEVAIRMESWLNMDTIRRMGFGHVIANHRQALIVERGVSFVAINRDGRPLASAYSANIFAPQRRYLIRYPGTTIKEKVPRQ